MKAHPNVLKEKALEYLRAGRGPAEVSERLSISIGAIEDWAAEWRKTGVLASFKRPGMHFTGQAKLLANGYYKSIRKRYNNMRQFDRIAKRIFGFQSPVEAIKFYLDEFGVPRSCAYCGRKPESGKVWGLDRLDSSLPHAPGNVVPCCGSHPAGMQLSCQASKSKYPLKEWLQITLSRAFGQPVEDATLEKRVSEIVGLAAKLAA